MKYDPIDDEFDALGSQSGGRKRSSWWLILPLAALFLILLPGMASYYSEWLWYEELGYAQIFLTVLRMKFIPSVIGTLIAALLIWLNFRLALRLSAASSKIVRYITLNGERVPIPDITQFIGQWVLPISLLIGAFFGLQVWESWETILMYRRQTPFGEADPIFGHDLAFYFFTLPLLELISQLLFLLIIIALIGTALIYTTRGGFRFSANAITIERLPRMHLFGLLAVLFLILAGRAWLEMPNLLYSTRGPILGASYTDVAAALPMLKLEVFVALLVSVLIVISMFVMRNRLLLAGIALYLLVIATAGWIYPAIVQRFSVAPNELVKETPYLAHNIAATRKAFALDRIEERELAGATDLKLQDIQAHARTINNIRLWDHRQLLDTFAQIQEFRTYYEFQSVDNDRYRIGGELRQTMISPRELSANRLQNRNWINERLSFTHGFGLTLGPVNQITPGGLPVLFIKDLPPTSSVPSLNVTQPELYFGELSHDPVYVKTTSKEFNYPAGDENVYTNYTGNGGVSIGSYWRRLLFAVRFGDMKLLLSNDMTPDSRVLYYRNIRERLGRLAPFLRFDKDPYLVISEGRLFWIADAYTTSDRYPYSQPIEGINYMRNSVKAVVDAYHGSVSFYVTDPSDPLIQTWAKIFPGVFKPLLEMSADLRSHLRYPEDIFKIQMAVYSTYHMNQPQVFYNKEDQWEVATVFDAEGKPQLMEPYYTIMTLPGEKQEEFILMLPFTPRSKDNLAAWVASRADGENYGRLLVYRFPKQRLVYGPKQIRALINQEAEISRQLSLWNQRGSRADLGTLLIIPIKESLIYVQPLYLRAESGKIPELKRVIVAAENRIAMEETLEASLSKIFGGMPQSTQPGAGETVAAATESKAPAQTSSGPEVQTLAVQAKQLYDRAMQAQREGDWARYGEEIKRLGAVIEQMSKQKNEGQKNEGQK